MENFVTCAIFRPYVVQVSSSEFPVLRVIWVIFCDFYAICFLFLHICNFEDISTLTSLLKNRFFITCKKFHAIWNLKYFHNFQFDKFILKSVLTEKRKEQSFLQIFCSLIWYQSFTNPSINKISTPFIVHLTRRKSEWRSLAYLPIKGLKAATYE